MKSDLVKKTKNISVGFVRKFKTLTLKKKLIVIGVFLAVIYVVFTFGGNDSDTTYKTEVVKKGNVVNIISETGEISTTGKTTVASTIKGIVADVYVENGDEVARGQDLFSVTSTATEEERATAYSNYQSAVSSLDTANSNYRSKQATAENILDQVSGHETDETLAQKDTRTTAEATRDNAYYSVVSAKANASSKWLLYQETLDGVVKSPASGTIANLAVAPGQSVVTTTNTLIVKSSVDTWVQLAVNEIDISTVDKGQKATVSVDALKDVELTGTVERVDDVGTVTSGVVIYNVYILLPELNQNIKPGMTVQVDIQTQKKEDVLVVSNSAIKPYQGGKAVQIIDDKTGELIYLPIEIGIVGPTKSEVVGGLEDGQEIVVSQGESGTKDQGGGLIRVPGGR
jgi:RND family efflux transporter MFP subunit